MSSSSLPPPSEPPPSSQIPGRAANSAPYFLGVVVLVALTAGLLLWQKAEPETQPNPSVPPPTPSQTAVVPKPEFAPPPPPKEVPDAGPDAETPTRHSGPPGPSKTPCAKCGEGLATSSLKSAVAARAGMARGCYNRALRTGGAEGSLMVSVSVGSNGNVCGASIVSDSVGSPSIAQCVVNKFRTTVYPKPKKGCVVINVPISFKLK